MARAATACASFIRIEVSTSPRQAMQYRSTRRASVLRRAVFFRSLNGWYSSFLIHLWQRRSQSRTTLAATAIAAIATAVDALDTVEADDAWADWRGCICGGGAYGEMVACDGGCDNWFHFACVGLAQAPRGEYICDACGAGFGFRRAYDDDEDTRALACLQENPKKPGTACNLRYEAYKSATTVAEFLEKGGTPADLTHDVGKGFVWYLDADDGRRPRGNQPRQ